MSYPLSPEPENKMPDDIEADAKDRDEYDDRLQPPDEDVTPEKEND